MAKPTLRIYVKVKIAWWLKPYLFGVVMTALITRLEPDWVKVGLTASKAIKCKFTTQKPLSKLSA